MAAISTTLKLIDKFTSPIQKSIDAIDKMIDAMEAASSEAMTADLSTAFHEARSSINSANRSLEEFNHDLDRMDADPPQNLSSGFGGLSKAIIVANQGIELLQKTWRGLESMMNKADERTSADARLSLIKDGLRTQEQLETQVLKVANDTRSSYAETANLIATMGRQDFFKGNNDLALQFAETLNKGFVVSGASAEDAKFAIRQLSQGIASGVLRGDEFNSVMENASVLAEMMAKEFGVTKGELRAMAEDGKLSADAVVTAIMNQSKVIDSQFAKMPMTFGQGMTIIGNQASELMNKLSQPGEALNSVILKVQELIAWLNTVDGQVFINGLGVGINFVIDGLMFMLSLVTGIYTFFTSNWSIIAPIIWGLVAAVIAYNAVMGIAWLTTLIDLAVKAAHTIASWAETAAIIALIIAQDGLNAALAACPLTWIIIAIIALITVFYVAVAAVNKFAGTSVSATGIIAGAFMAALAFIGNIFVGAFNLIIDGVAVIWNFIAAFAEFFANVFNDPIGSIVRLFSSMADSILEILEGIASAIDTIFGSNLSSAVSGWRSSLQGMTDDLVGEAKIKVERMDSGSMHLDRFNYGEAYNSGYDFGKNVEEKFSIPNIDDLLGNKGKDEALRTKAYDPKDISGIAKDADKIKDNTGKTGKEVDLSNQSLQYLRDIAEIEALKQFEAIDAYATVAYEDTEAKLSKQDKELLMAASSKDTNLYYLNYQGGVNVKNDIKKGEDWETIKRNLYAETQTDIEIGLSDIEEVVVA